MPPPAINTGLFVTRWTDLHLDEFHYPLNDGGSKPAFGRRSDSAANVRYGSWLCRNALPEVSKRSSFGWMALGSLFRVWLGPHRGDERPNAHDVHDPGQIVGQHV